VHVSARPTLVRLTPDDTQFARNRQAGRTRSHGSTQIPASSAANGSRRDDLQLLRDIRLSLNVAGAVTTTPFPTLILPVPSSSVPIQIRQSELCGATSGRALSSSGRYPSLPV